MKSLKFLLAKKFKVKSILNRGADILLSERYSPENLCSVNDATHYLHYSLFRILNKLLLFSYLASSDSCFPSLGQFSCGILFLSLSSTSLALQSLTAISRDLFLILLLHLCLARWVSTLPSHKSSWTKHTTATARLTFSIYKRPNFFHSNLYSSPLSCLQSSISSSSLLLQVLVQGDYNCSCPFCFKTHCQQIWCLSVLADKPPQAWGFGLVFFLF